MMRRFLYATTVITAYKVQETGSDFRLLALPDAISEATSPFEFHPAEMASLYQAGLRLGRDPASWCPAPEVPQRVPASASSKSTHCT